ncbi:thermonuclease family protein [Ascoidea rubescens DSM 1968]|uniref:Probable endonuclease LCL3 n=1 Tax=Ascoidea rubescens DSM 1968 TaxID=1344418 RepID=A0A1D2VB36_9ASCO|nr:SNase-domain-containing protein [Ascoidea rubescens DSM 1968]ODV58819.1 SNase-domain-containing protein [Ascoidea rubescens DSM 1968]
MITKSKNDLKGGRSGKYFINSSNSLDNKNRNYNDIILYTLLLTGSLIGSRKIYGKYFKRISSCHDIPQKYFHKRFLSGKVTSVGDGDNFHFFHTPGGIIGGWYWLRFPGTNRKELKNETLHIRLCGVDAPERSHFGKPSQPFSDESLNWLRNYILNKKIWIKPLRIDMYNRVVSKVIIKKFGFFNKDVSEEMIKNGIGIVYEGKTSAEFDNKKEMYEKHQENAKKKKLGLWGVKGKTMTPGQYKKIYR